MDERLFKLDDLDGYKTIVGNTVHYLEFDLQSQIAFMIADVNLETQDLGLSCWFSRFAFQDAYRFKNYATNIHIQQYKPLVVLGTTNPVTDLNSVKLPLGRSYLNIMNHTGGDKIYTIKRLTT